ATTATPTTRPCSRRPILCHASHSDQRQRQRSHPPRGGAFTVVLRVGWLEREASPDRICRVCKQGDPDNLHDSDSDQEEHRARALTETSARSERLNVVLLLLLVACVVLWLALVAVAARWLM